MINFFHYQNNILPLQNQKSGRPLVEIALPAGRQAQCGLSQTTNRSYDKFL
jgi:hypothetical protein